MTTTTLPTARPEGLPGKKGRPSGVRWMLALLVVAAAGVVGAAYLGVIPAERVKAVTGLFVQPSGHAAGSAAADAPAPESPPLPSHFDGVVTVPRDEQTVIGFNYAKVEPQTKPMVLEISGRTAYDTDTITKIRPRFDTRVESVAASIGQKVKKGDPLVELYSTDLAKAKTDYQTRYVQWQHDQKLRGLREKLVATGAISQQVWVDIQNDEMKSRLEFNIAADNLKVLYEVPDEEIKPLLTGLGDSAPDLRAFGTVKDKAKMTIRAKADGYVISRLVVPGNYYETTDVLMEIAPLDHLWVWVNVFEADQDKVRVGQPMTIQFPFMHKEIVGKVDYVSNEVSRETRAVRVRASIPNREGLLKSEMLVKAMLELPVKEGNTVVPRLAMVSIGGSEYVYVRKPGVSGGDDRFERHEIEVAQENTDHVVVTRGVAPGEEVVTNGSLIISQLYEDQKVTVTGIASK